MISAPANAASTSSDPATIAHTADRFVAHHMNLDASKAQTPAATMTKTAVSISSRHIHCSHRSQIQALWLQRSELRSGFWLPRESRDRYLLAGLRRVKNG
jgi:hypothetical protein